MSIDAARSVAVEAPSRAARLPPGWQRSIRSRGPRCHGSRRTPHYERCTPWRRLCESATLDTRTNEKARPTHRAGSDRDERTRSTPEPGFEHAADRQPSPPRQRADCPSSSAVRDQLGRCWRSGDHIRVDLRLDQPQRAGQYGRVISQESKTEHCRPMCGDRKPRTMGYGPRLARPRPEFVRVTLRSARANGDVAELDSRFGRLAPCGARRLYLRLRPHGG